MNLIKTATKSFSCNHILMPYDHIIFSSGNRYTIITNNGLDTNYNIITAISGCIHKEIPTNSIIVV